jgi:hypothetical protein
LLVTAGALGWFVAGGGGAGSGAIPSMVRLPAGAGGGGSDGGYDAGATPIIVCLLEYGFHDGSPRRGGIDDVGA